VLALVVLAACRSATTAPAPGPAVDRAAVWLAAFPPDQLRFDAAIGLSQIVRKADSEPARRAYAAARARADRDDDSPLRRIFDDTARVPAGAINRWTVPGPGQPRANVNRPVAEALHCDEHGLRPEVLAYLGGPTRDGGGYETAHALWALVLARDHGCLDGAQFAAVAGPLVDELRAAQPATPPPAVLAVDLYAERLLMLVLAGERDAAIATWATALIRAQRADGSFGVLGPSDPPYFQFHATLASAWALAEWASSRPVER